MNQLLITAQWLILITAFAAPIMSAQGAPVGYWGFEEPSGTTIVDSSGAGNNGTLVNGASARVAGKVGNALFFDGTTGGSSSRVVIPDAGSLDLTTAVSFAAWVKPVDADHDAPILAHEGPNGGLAYWFGVFHGGFGLLLDSDGSQPWSTDDSTRSISAVNNGEWTFLVTTWDGQTIRYYQDNQFLTSKLFSGGPLFNSSEQLAIGVNSGYNNTAFHGAIDELRVFNNALGVGDIAALYAQTTPVPLPAAGALMLAGLALIGRNGRRVET